MVNYKIEKGKKDERKKEKWSMNSGRRKNANGFLKLGQVLVNLHIVATKRSLQTFTQHTSSLCRCIPLIGKTLINKPMVKKIAAFFLAFLMLNTLHNGFWVSTKSQVLNIGTHHSSMPMNRIGYLR